MHDGVRLANRRLDGRLVERVARAPVDLREERVVRVRALATSAERGHRVAQLHSVLADLTTDVAVAADDKELGAGRNRHVNLAAALGMDACAGRDHESRRGGGEQADHRAREGSREGFLERSCLSKGG